MANKKVVPKAINLFVFPIRLKIATTINKNTIEITAIIAPTENTSFTFIKLLIKNKKGILKIPVSYTHLDVYKRQLHINLIPADPFRDQPQNIGGDNAD